MAPDASILPAISPAMATLLNRLAAAGWRLSLPAADAEMLDLKVLFAPAPVAEGRAWVGADIAASFGAIAIGVEAAFIDLLSDGLLPGWREETADRLPVEWRAVLALERLIDGTVFDEVHAVEARSFNGAASPDGPPLSTLRGTVLAAGHAFGFSLDLSGVDESRTALLAKLQPDWHINDFDPGFCCRLFLPGRSTVLTDYRALGTGDVLLAGTLERGRVPAILEVPHTVRASVGLDLASGLIDIFECTGIEKTMGEFDNDFDQSAFDAGTVHDEPALADPTEDLPVRLDFLLSTRRITLAELRALGPGATLGLNMDLAQPVTILANGAPAAKGHLVQIGDHIGVQISTWPGMRQKGDD